MDTFWAKASWEQKKTLGPINQCILDKNDESKAFVVLVSQQEGSVLVGSEPRRAWPCLTLAPCPQTLTPTGDKGCCFISQTLLPASEEDEHGRRMPAPPELRSCERLSETLTPCHLIKAETKT